MRVLRRTLALLPFVFEHEAGKSLTFVCACGSVKLLAIAFEKAHN
jgi:hypothetical protein